MRRLILSLCMAVFLLVACASAFPLSGQSGDANVTVYGIIPAPTGYDDKTRIAVDLGTLTGYKGTVSLVDEEDKFYRPSYGEDHMGGGWHKDRFFLAFDVPKGTVIKRLKFEPTLPGDKPGQPFSIDWESVPEVSGEGLTMKMYGVVSNARLGDEDLQNTWTFDVKLTNNRTENIPIYQNDFSIVDQYGWEYSGQDYVDSVQSMGQLMPGESMRISVQFSRISKLSRPVLLKYQGLQLDISAWT